MSTINVINFNSLKFIVSYVDYILFFTISVCIIKDFSEKFSIFDPVCEDKTEACNLKQLINNNNNFTNIFFYFISRVF